jgi:hypothetical protein
MTAINRYALGPYQQALLAAMFSPPEPLLTEQTPVRPKPFVENDDDVDYLTAD